MLLVDSSVWIEIFRRPSRIAPASSFDIEEVVTCLPVIQEVLQGFKQEDAFAIARNSMLAFPLVESPMDLDVFVAAADLYRTARRAGLSIRSGVDCVIAVCALRNRLTVLHHDRDFDLLAQVSPLQAQQIGLS
ncbi:MAG: PIN domain-containing protein [Actinomycetota bacterium]|nr:PIN domain-containing protein [Actinomycetota bacterium]